VIELALTFSPFIFFIEADGITAFVESDTWAWIDDKEIIINNEMNNKKAFMVISNIYKYLQGNLVFNLCKIDYVLLYLYRNVKPKLKKFLY
jgi:hypothetical protein